MKACFTIQIENIRWTWTDGSGQSRGVTTSSPASTAPSLAPGSSSSLPAVPVLFILGSCISLQFGAALATQLFPAIGSWGTTALRLGIAAAVLLLIVRPKVHRFTRQQWIAVIIFVVVIGGMNGAVYASFERIPICSAVAIVLHGSI